MFKKILFPTDGSENSERAMAYAIEVAKKFGSEVLVVHAHEIPGVTYGGLGSHHYFYFTDEIKNNLLETCEKLLEDTKEKFQEEKIRVKTFFAKGFAGEAIVREAENENCDLIVMGNKGAGALQSFLLGSVSNYVIHHSKCPALIIH